MKQYGRFIGLGLAQRVSSDSGQALVELAVGFSLMMLILLGAVEFGQMAYTSIEVANAAKAGVQYAAQNSNTANDTTGIQNAAKGSASDLTGMTVTSSTFCTCTDGSACDVTVNTNCPGSHVIETVTVNTQYSLTTWFKIPQLGNTITLRGKGIQECGH